MWGPGARSASTAAYHLSFAGTVTFKSAKALRDALAVTPLDRVLVETDAPYLTPHPWRGATNAPALVPVTVRVHGRGPRRRRADPVRSDQPPTPSASTARGERRSP
jgi:hypothetical protein